VIVRRRVWAGAALAAALFPFWTSAQDAGVRADYDRASALRERVNGKAVDVIADNAWIEGTTKLWYRKSVTGGSTFVLVDATAGTKAPAFDHARLAAALTAATGTTHSALTLPFTTITWVDNQQTIEFAVTGGPAAAAAPGGNRWRCTLTTYDCTRVTGAPGARAAPAGRVVQVGLREPRPRPNRHVVLPTGRAKRPFATSTSGCAHCRRGSSSP
jgi:hypothetical protein